MRVPAVGQLKMGVVLIKCAWPKKFARITATTPPL